MLPQALACLGFYAVAVVGLAWPQVCVNYQQLHHWVQLFNQARMGRVGLSCHLLRRAQKHLIRRHHPTGWACVRFTCFRGERPTYVHPVISFRLTSGFHCWRFTSFWVSYCFLAEFLLCLRDKGSPVAANWWWGTDCHPWLSVGVLVAQVALLPRMPCAGTPCSGLQVAKPHVSKSRGRSPEILAPLVPGTRGHAYFRLPWKLFYTHLAGKIWWPAGPTPRAGPTHPTPAGHPEPQTPSAGKPSATLNSAGSTFSSTIRLRILMRWEAGVDQLAGPHQLGGVRWDFEGHLANTC